MLADSEGRRGDLPHAALLNVIGFRCRQKLPEAGVIQVHLPGNGVTKPGTEVRRVQVGQGRRPADLGNAQPAAEYSGVGERGGRQTAQSLLDKAGGPVIGRGSEGGVADDHDAGPAGRAEIRPGRYGDADSGSEPDRGPGDVLPQLPGPGNQDSHGPCPE